MLQASFLECLFFDFLSHFQDFGTLPIVDVCERIVFEHYLRQIFDDSREWIAERNIFDDGLGDLSYEQSIVAMKVLEIAN